MTTHSTLSAEIAALAAEPTQWFQTNGKAGRFLPDDRFRVHSERNVSVKGSRPRKLRQHELLGGRGGTP
jgi:hypothetical protein